MAQAEKRFRQCGRTSGGRRLQKWTRWEELSKTPIRKGESMKILVVCGAGASSTFVAHRVRRTAAERGVDVDISAGSDSQLPGALAGLDALLIGPHLAGLYDELRSDPAAAGVALVLLPESIFSARDGSIALDLALDAVGALS